jgi:hypothetical protein
MRNRTRTCINLHICCALLCYCCCPAGSICLINAMQPMQGKWKAAQNQASSLGAILAPAGHGQARSTPQQHPQQQQQQHSLHQDVGQKRHLPALPPNITAQQQQQGSWQHLLEQQQRQQPQQPQAKRPCTSPYPKHIGASLAAAAAAGASATPAAAAPTITPYERQKQQQHAHYRSQQQQQQQQQPPLRLSSAPNINTDSTSQPRTIKFAKSTNIKQLRQWLELAEGSKTATALLMTLNKWARLAGTDDVRKLLSQGPEVLLNYYSQARNSGQVSGTTVCNYISRLLRILQYQQVKQLLQGRLVPAGTSSRGSSGSSGGVAAAIAGAAACTDGYSYDALVGLTAYSVPGRDEGANTSEEPRTRQAIKHRSSSSSSSRGAAHGLAGVLAATPALAAAAPRIPRIHALWQLCRALGGYGCRSSGNTSSSSIE